MVRPISAWKDIAHIILFHHERYDGKGYPTGKRGEDIPLHARIISVADAFDVITSKNSYKKEQKGMEEAIEELERNEGAQFDPKVVSALKKALAEERISRSINEI
jgi:HD-GYP domain-containing protein (c-di-GMP phosphodiesterase class II)